jgi:hypothetical protein
VTLTDCDVTGNMSGVVTDGHTLCVNGKTMNQELASLTPAATP